MKKSERELFKRCQVALDDWLHCYAPEQCDPKKVQESAIRTFKAGGTLAYIAKLQADIKKALHDRS